mmetsp:Transcript_48668/g.117696  ORF Transcript_48668/g.117696 Transcript_48668/m.117696 type:complete len:906 (-) Transcript_48668:87-2804(-)
MMKIVMKVRPQRSSSWLLLVSLIVTTIVLLPSTSPRDQQQLSKDNNQVWAFQQLTSTTSIISKSSPSARLTTTSKTSDNDLSFSPPTTDQTTTTTLFSSTSNNSPSTTKFDDDSLKFAFNEWKLMYGKQDEPFDRKRFRAFKNNYQALTMANLEARDQALKTGRPAPQWMTLNEYGDCTVDEYEQKKKTSASSAYSSSSSPSYGGTQVLRKDTSTAATSYSGGGTQVISSSSPLPSSSSSSSAASQSSYGGRGTQVISSSVSSSPSRGTQVISSSSPSSSNSYYGYGTGGAESQTQDQFGRTISIPNPENTSIRSTQPVVSGDSNTSKGGNDNKRKKKKNGSLEQDASSSSFGTQVIKSSSNSYNSNPGNSPIKGTQVIKSSVDTTYSYNGYSMDYQQGGTRVIQPVDTLSMDGRGGVGGTKVIKKADAYSSSQQGGTRVIQPVDSLGMSSTSWSSDNTSGTQIIKADKNKRGKDAPVGTKVLQTSSSRANDLGSTTNKKKRKGTIVVSKDDDTEVWSKFVESLPLGQSSSTSTITSSSSTGEDKAARRKRKRRTMSIKKSIPDPKVKKSFFDFMKGNQSDAKRATLVIKGPEKTAKKKSFLDSLFGGGSISSSISSTPKSTQAVITKEETRSSSAPKTNTNIFSLFSGKKESDDSRSVRGTITIPRNGKQQPATTSSKNVARKQTVLLDKEGTTANYSPPSILSFFGGSKKAESVRNPNARATLTINKGTEVINKGTKVVKSSSQPKNGFTQTQVARQREEVARALKKKEQAAAERAARFKERQERRKEASRLRVERAKAKIQEASSAAGGITKDVLFSKQKTGGKGTIAVANNKQKAGSLFGSFASISEIERWKQNRDGSLTGYVYKSKAFEDGTRITTSPVPKGAKRGSVVTTSGGTKYFLR